MAMQRPHCGNDDYDYDKDTTKSVSRRSERWIKIFCNHLPKQIKIDCILHSLLSACWRCEIEQIFCDLHWGHPGTPSSQITSMTRTRGTWIGLWSQTFTLLGARPDLRWYQLIQKLFMSWYLTECLIERSALFALLSFPRKSSKLWTFFWFLPKRSGQLKARQRVADLFLWCHYWS